MQHSESIAKVTAALAAAQLEIRNPSLDRTHPHFKTFRYASLGAHLDAVRGPLAKHGLILTQGLVSEGLHLSVTTMIAHESGEWIRSTVGMTLADNATAQNLGACATYLRRYSIAAMVLLTGDDDTDAEEDRQAKHEPKHEPRRDVFDPRPVAKPAPAPSRNWPKSGIGAVTTVRKVDRGNGIVAVLCSHPEFGDKWVSATAEMSGSLVDGGIVEMTWGTAKAGHTEAIEFLRRPAREDAPDGEELPF